MTKTFELKELKCPACSKALAENLAKIEYIKEININYDRKEITIEGRRDLTENEIKMILDTVIDLSHCPEHNHIRRKLRRNKIEPNSRCIFINHVDDDNSDNVTDEYMFDNIDCPNCALKVERALNKIEGVVEAKVNFVNKKIIITHHSNVSVYETVCRETKKIESEAIVYKERKKAKKGNKLSLIVFLVSVLLFIPTVIYWHVSDNHSWYMLVVFGVLYLAIGYKVLINSFKNFIHGEIFDENLLMLVASIGAFCINEPAEAILVILLYRIGEKLQASAIDRSTKEIEGLMKLKVEHATLRDGTEKELSEIKVGDEIVVKVGEIIPLDGEIIEGESSLDTKSLTGESLPVDVGVGSEVLSGCVNLTKVIYVKVTKVQVDSMLNKVVKLIDEASNKKSKTEEFITKFARIYTPAVLGLAVITGLLLFFAFDYSISETMRRVLVFLVVSCPCALVISVPLGFFGGIGKASSKGILVKGGNYLELLSKVNTFVFDKTGTLTEGNFAVDEIDCFNGETVDTLMKAVAHVESLSNHPIAKSIVKAYGKPIQKELTTNVKELSGYGLEADFDGHHILVGNSKLMKENNIEYVHKDTVGSVVYVGIDGVFKGSIVVVDELKPRSKETIRYMRNQKIKTVMLSGDNVSVVNDVKSKLNIDVAYGKLLPTDKIKKLEAELATGNKVAYVGDGINDTPSLKLANVGIAMGAKGSDIAKSAADIVIMNDDIGKVIDAIHISKKTMKIIYENIFLSLGIKVLVLVLSTLNLLGSYGMLFGVLSDVGLCMLAILNTLRIIYDKK